MAGFMGVLSSGAITASSARPATSQEAAMVAAIAYAAPSDLGTWLNATPPTNAASLLRSASLRVARACMRDPYTDQPGPTETQPLNDATCAQAASWIALGIDPAKLGLDPGVAPVKSSTILGGTVVRDTTGQTAALMAAATELCAEAAAILTTAGMINLDLPVFTSPDDGLLDYGLGDRPWGYYGFGDLGAWPFV